MTESTSIEQRGYAHPELLVNTDWVVEHKDDPNIRLLESNEDILLYDTGHIPGALKIDWHDDLNDRLRRDYVSKEAFEELASRLGLTPETTVVFYGDKNNWWATYALWVFQLFGHDNARIMDGGRLKWSEEGREWTREVPQVERTKYQASERDDARIRAFRDDVLKHLEKKGQLVDVRSPQEYSGEKLHMPEYPQEGAMRGGHIPTAKNIPWARAVNADGTFKSADDLREIYEKEQGLSPNAETIAYCRIGERSSHTWFVLSYLLGYPNVRNYDGSWTEWGNLVNAPIER
ncbi:MAG: sulfurtransferase [Ardenticatenales bacterium]|nr:sulfurtransferase [Ardenticatenales bacterium]